MIRRVFVEKRPGFDVEARELYQDIREMLDLPGLSGLRLLQRYDVEGLSAEEFRTAVEQVLSVPALDCVVDEEVVLSDGERAFAIAYLPGQFDQRADSAAQCIQILTQRTRPLVVHARVLVLAGELNNAEVSRIKDYCINTVDSHEVELGKPETLHRESPECAPVPRLEGFREREPAELAELRRTLSLAMSEADLAFCQEYFRTQEQRDPTLTEIRVLDTYWSDHCRHTTFLTRLEEVDITDGPFTAPIHEAWAEYERTRATVHTDRERPRCLMDLATLAMKALRRSGRLDDLEESEEINAASIIVPVEHDGRTEEWLVQFKNETHNHPTEIEPFGGAATCLGGAIRDPLSGRAYVYQAMRVTGSGDPRTSFEATLPGKLPQRKITREAARGYSSYGNQIGLATGLVRELYDEGFVAKRMEIGAVIGAAPRSQVVRGTPRPGDRVLLVGGRTGRDGIGGATGSSKEHDHGALENSAEVQKGDPPTERKLQRLFRHPEVSRRIVRCNDFGAGGVSVAIGELAPSLEIDLDAVPRKYEGLDGTELAISESQERMAVVLRPEDVEAFHQWADLENVEATVVARVTDSGRLTMTWRGDAIVDLARPFLDSNGVPQRASARISAPDPDQNPFQDPIARADGDWRDAWESTVRELNHCSQKGLIERFDSTIGAGTVLHPFGGSRRATPPASMVSLLPTDSQTCETATFMSFGYDPRLAHWSPFHSAVYAVVEAVSRLVATGADPARIRLTLQEYFPKPGDAPERWGLPLAALLGAFLAQIRLEIPAIGGKDSMSGTFRDRDVPPTLVAFAIGVGSARHVVSPEFKIAGDPVLWLPVPRTPDALPAFQALRSGWERVHEAIRTGAARAVQPLGFGGLPVALTHMMLGNDIGFSFHPDHSEDHNGSGPGTGGFLVETDPDYAETLRNDLVAVFPQTRILGHTSTEAEVARAGRSLRLDRLRRAWTEPLESIFPTQTATDGPDPAIPLVSHRSRVRPRATVARPRVFIPVFPGTNCEYDTTRAFADAGAVPETLVLRNLDTPAVNASIEALARGIDNAQILMLPGGFSAGDEPEGSAKFIAAVFRNPVLSDAINRLLNERDGLILGICNGFQALVKLGLLPGGAILNPNPNAPTLSFNRIGRHVSCYVHTRVTSVLSPWLGACEPGDRFTIPVSHGEGRFIASDTVLAELADNGQVATQYVDDAGVPTYDIDNNPNGSTLAIEGISSPDGRIFGKMGHSERSGPLLARNIPGRKNQPIFHSGVAYFS